MCVSPILTRSMLFKKKGNNYINNFVVIYIAY